LSVLSQARVILSGIRWLTVCFIGPGLRGAAGRGFASEPVHTRMTNRRSGPMNTFKTVTVDEVKPLLAHPETMLLDCRDLRDYRAGHIDNAMHLHEGLRETLLLKGDKQRPLVIYCYHGHASEHVAEMFTDFGFQNVYSLKGGFAAWQ
jgi:thiosulfate sulfurtransferase